MKKSIKRALLALSALGMAVLAQSCYFSSNCVEVESWVCYTQCDAFACWDVCDRVRECVYFDHNPGCFSNRDCAVGEFCLDGMCRPTTGNVPMCGWCNNDSNCGWGAICATLAVSNETVCLNTCSRQSDCGRGFECLRMSNSSVSACVPSNNSCDPNFCTTSQTCSTGQQCINNRCQHINTSGQECRTHAECRAIGLDLCVSDFDNTSYCSIHCRSDWDCGTGFECLATSAGNACFRSLSTSQCQVNAQCPSSQLCYSGRCKTACYSDWDCGSKNGYQFTCIHGVCQ
ncbi:MAG: hypothetical protein FWC40_01570 [Proteobacteria bacterium]|nr:hypothetical protein [Pseudomonadota bacterium]